MTPARDSDSAADPQRHADTDLILQRRAAHGLASPPAVAGMVSASGAVVPPLPPMSPGIRFVAPNVQGPAPTPSPAPAPPVWGLALSGGGIRSATVALGVLQAVAAASVAPAVVAPSPSPSPKPDDVPPPDPAGTLFRSSLLSRFDYLSTVSGGGYIGAFLCSLFLPGRLRAFPATNDASPTPPSAEAIAAAATATHATNIAAAADDAVRVLRHEPPGRLTGSGTYPDDRLHEAPLAWLRDNGRYLAPNGGGDLLYASSLALRNWIAVHYVIGTLLLGVFSLLTAVTAHIDLLSALDGRNLDAALDGAEWADQIWWSPQLCLPLVVLLLWALPAGLAYWIPTPRGIEGRCAVVNRAFAGYAAIVALVVAVWVTGLAPHDDRLILWAGGALAITIALVMFLANRLLCDAVETLRVRLTRQLMQALVVALVLAALGLVDTAAHSIYLRLVRENATPGRTLAPASIVAAFVWLVQRLAKSSDGFKPPAWLARLPLTVLGGAAGVAIFALTATAWALAVVWMQWLGAVPEPAQVSDGSHAGLLVWLTVTMVALAALTGQFPSFINLSSLQSFYGSRLTRAYLGASNGARFGVKTDRRKASVADPELQDGVAVADYLAPGTEPALATLAPMHLINVTLNNTVDPGEQLVQRDRKGEPLLVTPLGFSVNGEFRNFPTLQPRYEIERTLSVGQWIGTSGAAFSTGIGRQTSLGLSLLLGAANVRLGTWWESGAGADPVAGWPLQVLRAMFKTQMYLVNEFTAKFHGLRRRWQYLSDGGHFENTALYELLRPSRNVSFVIACDNGADPGYDFEDLANLIRLLRIDMGIELEIDAGVRDDPLLHGLIGVPDDFRAGLPHAGTAAAVDAPEPVALLLRAHPGGSARPSCWVLMIKPRVRRDSAVDVVQYALGHPAFPQEPTADQFFDEAQWESYRKLGHDNAAALLAPEAWAALHAHIARASRVASA